MLAPRSPLAAYRADLARRGDRGAFGSSDATWLTVATILSRADNIPADALPALLDSLRDVLRGDPALRDALQSGEQAADAGLELDAVSPIVRTVVQQIEDEGAVNLAYSILSMLADADLRLSVLERGRVLAHMGRVARKAGALDTSRERYRQVEVLGRTARSPELRVRAWVGYGILARLRGNYPEVRKWSARAAAEADQAGLAALGSIAYHSLMVSAGIAGDYDGALVYGWRAFQGATGNREREAEMLLNIAQLLYDSGHPDLAIHGFAAALAREPVAVIALPALGGMARAAAALGDAERARAARARAEQVIAGAGMPYEAAGALLELAQALADVGDTTGADECRARAASIARRHAFHELTHRLETLPVAAPSRPVERPHAFDSDAQEVARAVAALAGAGVGGPDGG